MFRNADLARVEGVRWYLCHFQFEAMLELGRADAGAPQRGAEFRALDGLELDAHGLVELQALLAPAAALCHAALVHAPGSVLSDFL